jgi:pyruvate,orthophosphate dikinase
MSGQRRWVWGFDQVAEAQADVGGDWEAVRGLLGGKGANLGEMSRLGLPVPPGFTVGTPACLAFLEHGAMPDEVALQIGRALRRLEAQTGKKLGDPERPLLVSCRSGAKFSMPGMMDTVLNLGLNDEVVDALAKGGGGKRFAHDAYRRLIHMFATVVMGAPDEPFDKTLEQARKDAGVKLDTELDGEAWQKVAQRFREIYRSHTGADFPQEPERQIHLATEAVFRSWNGRRAIDYRNAAGIRHDLGTAVNIGTMVFGNLGPDSASGVAMTRNGTTGEPQIEGDYLTNAQGEDVVAGVRLTTPIERLADEMPDAYAQLVETAELLEKHFRDMQDIEFTIEEGRFWMLQTRDAKRTAKAAVRIAADLAEEGLITRDEAVLRVSPEQVDFFLHPQFDPDARGEAESAGRLFARGLNVSPGAAVGRVAFDADRAQEWSRGEEGPVIMVRPETKPDDMHGLVAAAGVLTSRGGRTSHAALVARQFGKPAVVGAEDVEIDLDQRLMRIGELVVEEGQWISIDGTMGEAFLGRIDTVVPDVDDPYLMRILSWADERRRLGVWANADTADDAARARRYGAKGIGLCRTEHMFLGPDRVPLVDRMILAESDEERTAAIEALLPLQRQDFAALFRVMDGLPVVIRLIDPPLHEFLPEHDEVLREVVDLQHDAAGSEELAEKEHLLEAIEDLREQNPMLGLRGVRLGIRLPQLIHMQVRAIFEAACQVKKEGTSVLPEIMIPLTSDANELKIEHAILEEEAEAVMRREDMRIDYRFGTMIEIPRAALTAARLAEEAEFFSFGTNDLTQTTFGISRDDAERHFLIDYLNKGILRENPFDHLDQEGVGQLMRWAVEQGRRTRPGMKMGICGEHGGDPRSVDFCHRIGLDYVSCSAFRVPVARLAAAHAVLGPAEEAAVGGELTKPT